MMFRTSLVAGLVLVFTQGCSIEDSDQRVYSVARPLAICAVTLPDDSTLSLLVNGRMVDAQTGATAASQSYVYAEVKSRSGLLESSELVTAATQMIGTPRTAFLGEIAQWNAEFDFTVMRPSGPLAVELTLTGGSDESLLGVISTSIEGSSPAFMDCQTPYGGAEQVLFGAGSLSDKVPAMVSLDVAQSIATLEALSPATPSLETDVPSQLVPLALCESDEAGLSMIAFSGSEAGAAVSLIYVERSVFGVATTHDFYVADTASSVALTDSSGACNCDSGFLTLVKWSEGPNVAYQLALERDPSLTPSPSGLSARLVDGQTGASIASDLRCKAARLPSSPAVLF